MGRKPDPVIALHFVRGEKSGKNTNRYSQTCNHCNTVFPTGRQETLRAHLGRCPALTQSERSAAISQIYQPIPTMDGSHIDPFSDQNEDIDAMMTSNPESTDEFQRLDVLAGAAQNATDIAIDPALTRQDLHTPLNTAPTSTPYYNDHEMSDYHPEPNWVYPPIIDNQGPVTTYEAYPNITTSPTGAVQYGPGSFSQSPMVTYTPINTVASNFIPAPSANSDPTNQFVPQFVHETGTTSASVEQDPPENRARKAKEPYSQSKKAEVSNMRKIGACIRCSRLRKNCDPNRPCGQCEGTLRSKTWIGNCTRLQKGHQFTLWYEGGLQQLSASQVDQWVGVRLALPFKGHLELKFFGENGPAIRLDLLPKQDRRQPEVTIITQYIVDESKGVAQKLLDHANEHREIIIEASSSSMIYATARAAAGLSSPSQDSAKNNVWGSGIRGEHNLAQVFDIWLVATLLAVKEFKPAMRIIDADGAEMVPGLMGPSYDTIRLQINGALESIITKSEKDGVLHKFDANILSQSYKHLFDLVIGIVLVLNAVERYCAIIETEDDLDDEEIAEMVQQAASMADVYTYCVRNIKMMPNLTTGDDGCLIASGENDRVDWSLQRSWISDMFLTESELRELHFVGGVGLEGNLTAGLFTAMIEE